MILWDFSFYEAYEGIFISFLGFDVSLVDIQGFIINGVF